MYSRIKYSIVFLLLYFAIPFGNAQNTAVDQEDVYFVVRGSVRGKYSYEPISDASIQVNGGSYVTTAYDGGFKIKVKIGDEVIISHKEFQTVYHTIDSNDRLLIEVLPQDDKPTQKAIRRKKIETFNQLIDSADTYLKTDSERSVQFIADALNKSVSQSQNAEAYLTLGNLYMFLKQYDLAVTNYRIALQNQNTDAIKLKLAKAYMANNNFDQSIKTYNQIEVDRLTNYQKTEFHEGFGDVYLKTKAISNAISSYNKGLNIAKTYEIKPKITDFNSKLAQAYNANGNEQKAKGFFDNSLKSARQISKKRAVEEKVTVAEFNSGNRNYEEEISLRKQVVDDVKEIEKDSIIPNESPITPQKQNYKIGNALILQNKLDEALPYLDESIIEAEKRGDLEVKKDAQRRKVDVFEGLGEYDKAKVEFEAFMASVDKLYLKKQQEISNATRTSRNIRESQNRITSLENDRELSKTRYEYSLEKSKNQQIIIYSLIGGLALFLIAAYFTLKYIKQQRLANNLLALKSLRSQMNPHFIFNALNSVNSFIATNDERAANRYLSEFSFLMRAVLENSEEDFIPLSKEIELITLYTKLEHFRFQDKFEYSIEVDKAIDIEAFEIPPMLLQPYIENAVWHGLRYKTEKGILNIEIKPTSKDEISIAIIDNGIGRKRSRALKTDNQKKHNSKGLSNIKKRIQILNDMYKDKVDVSIDDYQKEEDTGTRVEVMLKKD